LASTANDFTWHATLAFSSNIGFVVTPVTLSHNPFLAAKSKVLTISLSENQL
jgi:hypothetical protein